MNKAILIVCLLFSHLTFASEGNASESPETIIGSYFIPGLVINDKEGLFVKMHHEIFRRISLKSKLVIQPTQRVQISFKHNQITAYFPELLENLPKTDLVTSTLFWLKKIVLFSRKDSPITNHLDLKYKRIGAVSGYSYGVDITQNPLYKIEYVKDDRINIEKLMHGRIDAIVGDTASTLHAINDSQYSSQIYYDVNKPINILKVFYVCQATYEGKELCQAISNSIKELQAEGKINLDPITGDSEINL